MVSPVRDEMHQGDGWVRKLRNWAEEKSQKLPRSLPPWVKSAMHRFGSVLGIVGVVFVGIKLYGYWGQIGTVDLTALDYALYAALILIYGVANLLMAAGWRNLMRALGFALNRNWSIWAYATSQLAKYVPGNVFHFAGRQSLGVAAGLPNVPLLKSTFLELAFQCVCGALFAPLVLPLFTPMIGFGGSFLLFVIAAAATIGLCRRVGGGAMAAGFSCYFIFEVIAGLLFVANVAIASGDVPAPIEVTTMAGAFVLAWLIGLVTPGAPAGLGVREAVLLYLLHDTDRAPIVVLVVLLGRIITVSGDFLFYAAGRAFATRTALA